MSEHQIKPGNVVKLNSGGPEMTVTEILGNNCYCVWFNDTAQTFEDEEFPILSLTKITEK